MNKKFSLGIICLMCAALLFACSAPKQQTKEIATATRAKFEPADGEVILFIGQEMDAIGGLEDFNDGYLDHFDAPGGFTMYTNFSPGGNSFGHIRKGLDGIWSDDNWGDSISNMSRQLADPDFQHMALAIGLEFVDHDAKVAKGTHDELIEKLGEFIKGLGKRPVFLRIGYEFGGAWNHYDQKNYLKAFKRVRDKYEEMGIDNIAYVWQSHGWEEPMDHLEAWYPGDEYVDWVGYSFFSRFDETNMIEFARKHKKPLFIAEATATVSTGTTKVDGKTKEIRLDNPEQAAEAKEKWFKPFFKTIEDNPDVVKAISYINCNWRSHAMWRQNPTFQDVDARLQLSEDLSAFWKEETSKDKYLKSEPNLWEYLWGK
ncbi:MAG: glycosyl hydrolase [Bacteroidota bacterium]